jgi:endonuclease III
MTLRQALRILRRHYGPPVPLPTTDPFELILWENVAYLASDARRAEAFAQLRDTIGTTPAAILAAPRSRLEAVTSHGILKGAFAGKLLECARIAVEYCDGDVGAALRRSPDTAKRTLRRFPGIGEPGAEKILLFAGLGADLAPESNGLRVLVRLGFIADDRSYSRRYAASRIAAKSLPATPKAMREAHLLLRQHGQTLCKRTRPRCEMCPLEEGCAYARLALKTNR